MKNFVYRLGIRIKKLGNIPIIILGLSIISLGIYFGIITLIRSQYSIVNFTFLFLIFLLSIYSIYVASRYHILQEEELKKQRLIEDEKEQRNLAEALMDISSALNSTLDIHEVSRQIFSRLASLVPFNSCNIMLIDEKDGKTARVVDGKGYFELGLQNNISDLVLSIDETPTLRKMFESGMPLAVPDTKNEPDWVTNFLTPWIMSYIGAPIKVQEKIIGFLNLNSNVPDLYNQKMTGRLQAFANQAGIAINKANQHEKLINAYQTTLEGWAILLDLRDEETEGHSRRVVEITMMLAKKFGITDPDLTYLRYGALLHDVGKNGIPDAILLEPGPLSDDDWLVMKRHPQIAYDSLSGIEYLKPALDIPFCHHEKWDGTGYPRGLKGLEIPIAARLFAIVDVWDALSNKRRYRPAWPQDRIINHLEDQSGKHFQPEIVKTFIEIIASLA